MGYAMFTARKLLLTNRINQLNARMMQLTQQQQTLADSAAKLERALSNQKSIFQTIGNLYQSSLTMQQQAAQQSLFSNLQASGEINQDAMNQYATLGLNGMFNFAATPMGAQLTMQQQMFEQAQNDKIQQIKNMENEIELQVKSIDTQLQAATKELSKVEDAEKNNIDRSAPKYA